MTKVVIKNIKKNNVLIIKKDVVTFLIKGHAKRNGQKNKEEIFR